ncbi:MAG: bifunctional diaminohydroxyphosphoribosylaminopyrimidine deaminase/5-amino-6-(5-phosphoribosylamino)uracil reductase RibD [Prevotellaceae bacterium]|nr:bifunctional diaminohydroxyphosphoribosylaminopyrimidine deaminase/5-amino-6-(5-phosphoribosylamino)uracil reductase RibD [Prevotellaceae bacterium]
MKPNTEKIDELYMRRCLQLARGGEGNTSPNPMVGAVIVHEGRIIGEGYHIKCGGPHAEVNAIASVKEPQLLCQSTMYVSLEPCAHFGKTPPCADLIVEKRIKRVVVGCTDPFAKVNGLGIKKLRDAGIDVTVGVLEAECQRLNRRFFTRQTLGRPYIILKWAQSGDGFIDRLRAEHSAESPARLSTPITQTLVHQLRAGCDAILVGTRTALLDNSSLTVRLWTGTNPLRLVIDPKGTLPQRLRVFDGEASTRAYVQEGAEPAYASHEGVTVVKVEYEASMTRKIMDDLAAEQVQSLIVEGGAATLGTFISENLWDEARVETAPTKLSAGVEAPRLSNALLVSHEVVDGNLIELYARRGV